MYRLFVCLKHQSGAFQLVQIDRGHEPQVVPDPFFRTHPCVKNSVSFFIEVPVIVFVLKHKLFVVSDQNEHITWRVKNELPQNLTSQFTVIRSVDDITELNESSLLSTHPASTNIGMPRTVDHFFEPRSSCEPCRWEFRGIHC